MGLDCWTYALSSLLVYNSSAKVEPLASCSLQAIKSYDVVEGSPERSEFRGTFLYCAG